MTSLRHYYVTKSPNAYKNHTKLSVIDCEVIQRKCNFWFTFLTLPWYQWLGAGCSVSYNANSFFAIFGGKHKSFTVKAKFTCATCMTSFIVSVTQSIIPVKDKLKAKKKKRRKQMLLLPHIYNQDPLKVAKRKRCHYMQHTLKGLTENSVKKNIYIKNGTFSPHYADSFFSPREQTWQTHVNLTTSKKPTCSYRRKTCLGFLPTGCTDRWGCWCCCSPGHGSHAARRWSPQSAGLQKAGQSICISSHQ